MSSVGSGAWAVLLITPALLMRMVTLPNASSAVLTTASPSVTEELFTTALPPAAFTLQYLVGSVLGSDTRALSDLIHNLLRGLLIKVVYNNICASRSELQGVTVYDITGVLVVSELDRKVDGCGAYTLPRPPPAPVTTTVWPLNESWDIVEGSGEI